MAILDSRVISGKGVIRVPLNEDSRKAKILTLYAEVIREPRQAYRNYEYNPPRSVYGRLVFLRENFVVRDALLQYTDQVWEDYPEIGYQTTYALQCAYQGILASIANLGTALGATVINIEDRIKDWRHAYLFWDEVKLVCFADTAVRLTVSSSFYDLCPDQEDPIPYPPPETPPPPNQLPPGTPLQDSEFPYTPPYDGDTDDGDSVPFPGDEPLPPPPDTGDTVTGRVYQIAYSYRQFEGGSVITQGGILVLGKTGTVRFKPGDPNHMVQVLCQGRVTNRFDPPPPLPLDWYDIQEQGLTATDLNFVSIQDVTP